MTQSRAPRAAALALALGGIVGCSRSSPIASETAPSALASARPAPSALAFALFLAPDGVHVKTRAGDVAPGCDHPGQGVAVANKGAVLDEAALNVCAAKLKAAAPDAKDDTRVTISAAPETPYQTLVAAMDAVRKTASGESLFPEVTFGLPSPAPSISPVSGAPSKVTPPTASVAGAADEGLVVVVSKRDLAVDDTFVASVPPDGERGFETDCKRNGRGDMYVVPLGKTLKRWRERDMQVRMATGKDPSFSEAIIVADASTPYRLLSEVLFTLGQSDFNKYHLMVRQK